MTKTAYNNTLHSLLKHLICCVQTRRFHSGKNSSEIITIRISVLRSTTVTAGKSDFSCLILGRSSTVTFDVFINSGALMCNKINEKRKHNAHRKENFDPFGNTGY